MLLLLSGAAPSVAAEIAIEYPALERILARQLFTEDGRRYVRGSKDRHCNFAYLENPHVSGDNGRLRINAHFSGRSAQNFFGYCFGLGDSFAVSIELVPYYKDGVVAFRDVRVQSPGRDGFYIRAVCAVMAASLTNDFQYHLYDDARQILEEHRPGEPYSQQLRGFRVQEIRVTDKALILVLDFNLVIH